jgi:hypothetical protein
MDDWFKQMQSDLVTATREMVDLMDEASKKSEKEVRQLLDDSIEVMEDVEQLIAPSLTAIDQSLEAGFGYLDQHLTPWLEEVSAPVTHTVNPWLQSHPACIGCRHYHGISYGDEMMVCAMYPYGPESETCNDWESVWTDT